MAVLPAASLLFLGVETKRCCSHRRRGASCHGGAKRCPIYGEWVATLDGYVNAQIHLMTGYIIRQTYKKVLLYARVKCFQIDPRPFQAVLDQAKAQLAQAQAQLGRLNSTWTEIL